MLANAEGRLPVDDWGSIDWWPPLPVAGGEVALEEDAARLPDLPQSPACRRRPSPRRASRRSRPSPRRRSASGYLFFVAGCPSGDRDGSHYFARTLDEHNANIAQANDGVPGQ